MKEWKLLLTVFVLASVFNIIISFFVEIYPLGYDPIEHYQLSLEILKGNFPTDRTFLYNGILSIFLFFNQDYWITQVVNAFISNLFIFPLYYIAKSQFSRKIAKYSILLITISPFTIFGIATTPKPLVVFFILIVYYFTLKKEFNKWLLISSILALLTHQLSLFFIIPAFILVLKGNWKRGTLFSTILVIILAILVIFNNRISTMIYFPIAVNGWESVKGGATPEVWADFYSTPWYKMIGTRVVNFFIPITPLLFPTAKTVNMVYPLVLNIHKTVDFSTQPWAYHYMQSLSGGIGIILYMFAVLGVWRMRKTKLLFLIISSYIVCVLFFGYIVPVISSIGLIFFPLFLMIGLTQAKDKWMKIIIISLIIELILMFITFGMFIGFTKEVLKASGTIDNYIGFNSLYELIR